MIAIYCNCTWSRTARLLTTNNPRYPDNDTFSAISVVTFQWNFLQDEFSNYSSVFEGGRGGVRLPTLWLKVSTPLTYFAEGLKKPFRILYWRKLLFFLYKAYTHCTTLCLSNRNSLSFSHLSEFHWHFSILPWFHEFQ